MKSKLVTKIMGMLLCLIIGGIGGYNICLKVNVKEVEVELKPVVVREISTKQKKFVLSKEAVVQNIKSASKLITEEIEINSQPIEIIENQTKYNLVNKFVTKKKTLVLYGKGYYYVDLTKITQDNIFVDNANKKVVIQLPELQKGDISINEDKCTSTDTTNGYFRYGEMTFTDEENKRIQKEAKQGILDKMNSYEYLSEAKELSKSSFEESLGKIIKKMCDYDVTVTF